MLTLKFLGIYIISSITVAVDSLMTNIEAAPQGFPPAAVAVDVSEPKPEGQAERSLAAPQSPFIL